MNAFTAFATDSSVDIEVNIAPVLNISVPQPAEITINATNIGALQTTDITADVATNNITGYTLTMSSTSTDLVNNAVMVEGKYPTIPTLQENVTSSNFTTNRWGISFDDGDNYAPFTTSHQFTPTTGPANHSYTNLKAGVKIGLETGAGTYTNTINFAAVANALPATWDTMTTMQEMTPEICASQPTPTIGATIVPAKQLEDTRDGKLYWISKLADGNCWMTQNLDLGGAEAISLNSTSTDLVEGNTFDFPAASTWAYSGGRKIYLNDPGDNYFVTSGSTSDDIKYTSLSDCTMANPVEVCEHGHNGNYYNWHAAAAGSAMQNGDASQSICPKGWRLPKTQSWSYMLKNSIANFGDNAATSQAMRDAPFYILRVGGYSSNPNVEKNSYGYYWSSTIYNDVRVYLLYFNQSTVYSALGTYGIFDTENDSFSVRCVAR